MEPCSCAKVGIAPVRDLLVKPDRFTFLTFRIKCVGCCKFGDSGISARSSFRQRGELRSSSSSLPAIEHLRGSGVGEGGLLLFALLVNAIELIACHSDDDQCSRGGYMIAIFFPELLVPLAPDVFLNLAKNIRQ